MYTDHTFCLKNYVLKNQIHYQNMFTKKRKTKLINNDIYINNH